MNSLNPKLKAALPYIRNVYTSLFAGVSSLLFSYFILNYYLGPYLYNEVDLSYPAKVFSITLMPLISIATVAIVHDYFDNVDLFGKREYFESKSKKPLIARYPYLVSFAISMLFSTLLFSQVFHITLTFYFPNINIAVSRFLAVAVMAVLRLFQIWSLQDKWQTEIENPLFVEKAMFKRNRDMNAFKPHQLILQPIGYFFAFLALSIFTGVMIIPNIVFPILVSGVNSLLTPEMWWMFLGLPLIVIAIILAFRLLHNIRKRLILLKRLKQIQREGLGRVEIFGSKFLSSTFITLPFTVRITDREGEVYNCAVATCGEINAPMFFKTDEFFVEHGFHLRGGALLARGGRFGYVVDISNFGGKENPTNLVFGFRTSHKLKFPEGEGHRVVILNPTPTTAYAIDEHSCRPIDTGENMGEYTLYTATGLFNHIERQSRKGRRDYDY